MCDVSLLFEILQPPRQSSGGGSVFSAFPIPAAKHHRLGKDASGEPAVLLASGADTHGAPPPPIRLRHLTVQYNAHCRILRPGGNAEEGRFTVIRCIAADSVLTEYFLRVAGTLAAALGVQPAPSAVTEAIDKLVELFQSLSAPPRKTIQGLWAELLLIVHATDAGQLVRAWHATFEDLFDFNAGDQRVEVKSASGQTRRHHFALSQLQAPKGSRIVIASILVERSGAGVTVHDLAAELRGRLMREPDLVARVDLVLAHTLGASWFDAGEMRFDRQRGRQSIALFDAGDIPSVDPELPPDVSEVRFIADLSNARPLSLAACRRAGGLIGAAVPR